MRMFRNTALAGTALKYFFLSFTEALTAMRLTSRHRRSKHSELQGNEYIIKDSRGQNLAVVSIINIQRHFDDKLYDNAPGQDI